MVNTKTNFVEDVIFLTYKRNNCIKLALIYISLLFPRIKKALTTTVLIAEVNFPKPFIHWQNENSRMMITRKQKKWK